MAEKGAERVNSRAIVESPGTYFFHRRIGAFCRGNRITQVFGFLIFIGIKQGPPCFHHVPLHIVGEHTQKYVSPHAVFGAVANGAYHEICCFEGTKRSFDLAEQFIAAYRLVSIHSLFGQAGPYDVDSIECSLLFDLVSIDSDRQRLSKYNMAQSMSRQGNCLDNAAAESFFHTLKVEEVYGQSYETRQEAKSCIFEYIEVFYNRKRRHSYLGLESPQVFEDRYNEKSYENAA